MSPPLTVHTIAGMHEVDAASWDALAAPDDPFIEHRFLAWLEASGSVSANTGWRPMHLLVRDAEGVLVGAAPMYLKDHSYGEFIFDWAWANASQRAGVPYYPKLVSMVPLTPATGSRLLVHPQAARASVVQALAEGARALAEAHRAPSIHWLFTTEGEQAELTAHGFRARRSYQYHWLRRPGWSTFEDFLASLTAHRRKEVRRERAKAASTGLELATEPLVALSDADLAMLEGCYRTTIDDHGGVPYLTPAWFHGLREALGARGLVATARRDGRLVAASLAFHKGRNLYGRYWGALEPAPALHFELCYHSLIAWALAHGIERFEAGAQGEHKIQRGLLPSPTWSSHALRHPGLDRAVAAFLEQEAEQVLHAMGALAQRSPFREEADEAQAG